MRALVAFGDWRESVAIESSEAERAKVINQSDPAVWPVITSSRVQDSQSGLALLLVHLNCLRTR